MSPREYTGQWNVLQDLSLVQWNYIVMNTVVELTIPRFGKAQTLCRI